MTSKEKCFHDLSDAWAASDQRCRVLHNLWKAECANRRELAAQKNEAWSKWQPERHRQILDEIERQQF